jgi:membrane fusion protein (multidrug efflux system)
MNDHPKCFVWNRGSFDRLWAPILLGGLVGLLVSGCQPAAPVVVAPPVVEVVAVSPTNVPLSAIFIGRLDSPQNVEVRARVEAFVDKMLFTEGREVQAGELLFALDAKPFLERLAGAEGALAEAQAALNKYEKDVARLAPLAQKKAIPQQDLDNAQASVEVGKASVLTAKARLEAARIDLGYCEVKAPVAGLVGASQVAVGSLVGKGQPTLLATISTLDPIWFYCAISEVDFLRAERKLQESGRQLGDVPVTLILADDTELGEPGKWVFLDRAVDAATGTLRARAEFANARKLLRPGMFARVRIGLKMEQDSLLVPQRAVQELQGKTFVWLVDAASKATQRSVQVGAEVGSDVIILGGLKAGDRLIVEGVQKVREGALVQAKTAAQIAAALAAAIPAPEPKHEKGAAPAGKE